MIDCSGFKDAQSFVNSVPPMPPHGKKPDLRNYQHKRIKNQVQAQKAVLMQNKSMKIIMDDDRQRDEAEADIRIKAAELA